MEKAYLVDLLDDFPRELRDAFNESGIELNGNPWYYRWCISRKPWDMGIEIFEKINAHLISMGLSENDTIFLTDGW